MLRIASSPTAGQGAMGQHRTVTYLVENVDEFGNPESMIGEDVTIDAGLFIDQLPLVPGNPPDTNCWKFTYPSQLQLPIVNPYQGDQRYRNLGIAVIPLTAYTFQIFLEYIHRADVNGWNSENLVENANSFESTGGIYNQGENRFLALRVYVGDKTSVTYPNDIGILWGIRWMANDWCSGPDVPFFSTKIDGVLSNNQYEIGKDLEVEFTITGVGPVNNIYQAGVYVTTGVDPNSNFVPGTNLKMGKMIGGALPVGPSDELGVLDLVSDQITLDNGTLAPVFVAGTTIQEAIPNNAYSGSFTISGNYLNGDSIRVFIVYKQGGEWKSCRTPVLTTSTQFPPTYGSTDCKIQIGTQTYNTCCLVNVPPHLPLRICNTMNESEYNMAVISNGVTGDYETNLKQVRAILANELPLPGQQLSGITLEIDEDQCVDLIIPEDWAGTQKFVVFEYVFDYGTHMDVIYSPVDLQMTAETSINLDSLTLLGDNENLEYLCIDNESLIEMCLSTLSQDYLLFAALYLEDDPVQGVVQIDPNFAGDDACLQIDPVYLEQDSEYCLKAAAIGSLVPVNPPNPELCGCWDVSVFQQTDMVGSGQVKIRFGISYTEPSDLTQIGLQIIIDGVGEFDFSGQSVPHIFTFDVPANDSGVYEHQYFIRFTLSDGCQRTTSFSLSTLGEPGDIKRISYDICAGPRISECANNPSINPACDEEAQQVNANFNLNGALPTSDTKEYSTDGINWIPYTGSLPYGFYYFRWKLGFSDQDDCPDLVLFEDIDCFNLEIQQCNNQPKFDYSYDSALQVLTVIESGQYSSQVINYNFDYSLDLGVTWQQITGQIDVSGLEAGDQVHMRLNPIYADQCPQGPEFYQVWTKNSTQANCDYSNWFLECAYDEITEVFSAEFGCCVLPDIVNDPSELEIDDHEYSIDHGQTWQEYTGDPIQTTGQVVLFRRTMKYPGCEPSVLVAACAKPCEPCIVNWPESMDVNIIGPIEVQIPDCIEICDTNICTDPPDAGIPGSTTACVVI